MKFLPQPTDFKEGVAYIFQVIRNVSVPFGAPYQGKVSETYPTWWVSAADLTNRTYFFNMTASPKCGLDRPEHPQLCQFAAG